MSDCLWIWITPYPYWAAELKRRVICNRIVRYRYSVGRTKGCRFVGIGICNEWYFPVLISGHNIKKPQYGRVRIYGKEISLTLNQQAGAVERPSRNIGNMRFMARLQFGLSCQLCQITKRKSALFTWPTCYRVIGRRGSCILPMNYCVKAILICLFLNSPSSQHIVALFQLYWWI